MKRYYVEKLYHGLFESVHGWGEVNPHKNTHIYPTMMKLGTVIPCLKKIEKHMNQVTHPVNSADIYHPEICKFSYIKKYRYRLHFDTWFLILITFFWVFKNFFNKHANNLDDVSENGYFRPF